MTCYDRLTGQPPMDGKQVLAASLVAIKGRQARASCIMVPVIAEHVASFIRTNSHDNWKIGKPDSAFPTYRYGDRVLVQLT